MPCTDPTPSDRRRWPPLQSIQSAAGSPLAPARHLRMRPRAPAGGSGFVPQRRECGCQQRDYRGSRLRRSSLLEARQTRCSVVLASIGSQRRSGCINRSSRRPPARLLEPVVGQRVVAAPRRQPCGCRSDRRPPLRQARQATHLRPSLQLIRFCAFGAPGPDRTAAVAAARGHGTRAAWVGRYGRLIAVVIGHGAGPHSRSSVPPR